MKPKKYDIFISYRRDGGEFTPKLLRDRLEAKGYSVFFDVETLRSGDFNTRLYSVIDECKDFLLVLSPNALDRCANEGDWVRYEVERALLKGKNIIPIMLRGFSFPDVLPPSMEPIRLKNGLEANSQFFDAFLDTLLEYLSAAPQKRRTVAWLLSAAAILLAAAVALTFALRERPFPATSTEKSVTGDVIYYIESHMTYLDMIADAASAALEDAQRYLTTDSTAFSTLDAAFDTSLANLAAVDLDTCAPTDGFLQRVGALEDSPFATADLVALHDVVVMTRTEWMGNLPMLLMMLGPDSYIPDNTLLAILDNMQSYLQEDLALNAYNTNELLLPVKVPGALDSFFQQYLPTLRHIPLDVSSWSDDAAAIAAAEEACANRQTQLVTERSAMVGNTTMDSAALRESLIRSYELLGMTPSQAEAMVEQWLEVAGLRSQVDTLLQQFRPAPGDGWDTLWIKLQTQMGMDERDFALECLDALEALPGMEDDADAAVYFPALRRFIQSVDETGIDYGVMVMGWVDPEQPHPLYQIGDVIIAVNGMPCRTVEEFTAARDAVTAESYSVTILRPDESGALAQTTLDISTDMPKVYIQSLTFLLEEENAST